MIILFFALAGLTGYIIGCFTGRRYAQQQIKEMRLDMGLDPETGEENNEKYK